MLYLCMLGEIKEKQTLENFSSLYTYSEFDTQNMTKE